MKRLLIVFFCTLGSLITEAQTNDLLQFNQKRIDLTKKSMIALGAWSAGNIGYSGVQMTRKTGTERYFHQMNVGWNVVNLTIAGLGYWGTTRINAADFDLKSTLKEHHKIQKVLMLNTGLDLAYMAGGAYLIESAKSNVEMADRAKGFGQSLILQGGFLFVFDIVQLVLHQQHNGALDTILDNIEVNVSGNGLGISYQF